MKYLKLLLFITLAGCYSSVSAQLSSADSLYMQANNSADLHVFAARMYFDRNLSGKALEELEKAQELYGKINNTAGQASVLEQFGDFYAGKGYSSEALTSYQKAFDLSAAGTEQAGNLAYKLASLCYKQKRYDDALKYSIASSKAFDAAGLKANAAKAYVLTASIKKQQKNYNEAEDIILKQALPLYRSADNAEGRTGSFDVLARTYLDQKRYSEAKWFFIQANTQSRILKDTVGIITSLTNLAKVKNAIKDYKLALRDLKEAEILAKRTHTTALLADVKTVQTETYARLGYKTAAAGARQDVDLLNDSLRQMAHHDSQVAHNAVREMQQQKQAAEKPVARHTAVVQNTPIMYIVIIAVIAIAIILIVILKGRRKLTKG
ncbi:hypothetical protein FW774_19935 [Pedobacter sp. BS3]|uniref:hypothetical protein n=1 Tax=Pedobacter sp. BS3 TaxID=2567937 RepID=UPI0011EF9688|nr:hypothetical protein [Pedobacter sp. BS3]TZF80901.1 hypothetical protein FW774_19935 [Pedobacter sp. BS3]